MIRIRDLRVDYDNICAVDDLSLEVEPGEVCGLIGPNGAGKTTTMKALLGLIEPTYGEIEVMGVDMRERPEDVYRVDGVHARFPAGLRRLAGLGVPRSLRRQLRDSPRSGGRSKSIAFSRWSGLPRSGSRSSSSCRAACGSG